MQLHLWHRSTKIYWLFITLLLLVCCMTLPFLYVSSLALLYTMFIAGIFFAAMLYLVVQLVAKQWWQPIIGIDILLKFILAVAFFYILDFVLLSTPHPFISPSLQKVDEALGFNSLAAAQWMFAHPVFAAVCQFCYKLLIVLVVVVLVMVNILGARIYAQRLLNLYILGLIFCYIFAYYFPSYSPIVFIEHKLYLLHPHNKLLHYLAYPWEVQEYQHMQHHLAPIIKGGFNIGLVAFPSFHTFSILFVLQITWQKLRVFFWPLIVMSIFVCIAMLGFAQHYILDIFGGILLYLLCYYLEQELMLRV